jgi:mono/diheme cytochrome c family protein
VLVNRLKIILPFAAVLALTVLSGCKFQATADEQHGRMLFVERCGTCHVLAEAGTQATVGPNLDFAFAQGRKQGMDSDTFEGIIKAQVENPRPSTKDPRVSMPADLVKGRDLEDVAAYVASVAGVPGAKPPAAAGGPGGQVFATNGCGSCHTLAVAGATGTVGPDLDKVLKGQTAAQIMESIVNPNAKIAKGYPANVMPATFKSLPPAQLKQLVEFLLSSAGRGK